MSEQEAYGEIRGTLDELGAPRGSTTSMRIRGLHRVVVQERDEAICQRDEAVDRVIETVASLDAAEDALTECAVTDAETLSDRIRELAARAAKYHGALAGANSERDEALRHLHEAREVLRKEREERATEKATLGAALHTLRAETDNLGESVDRLHEENERLAAQLEFAERVLIAGIRRVVP